MAKKKVEVKEIEMTEEQKTKAMIKMLKRIHKESYISEDGYTFTTPEEHSEALDLGFLVVNPEICNEDDTALATVLTPLGEEFAGIVKPKEVEEEDAQPQQVEEKPVAPKGKSMHLISAVVADVELPKTKRGSGRTSPYPFDSMEVGHSFFVADDERKASVVLAPAVAIANKRGKDAGKRFACRTLADGAAFGMAGVSGAMVKRLS